MIHLVEKEFKINPPIISFRKDKLISSFLTLFFSWGDDFLFPPLCLFYFIKNSIHITLHFLSQQCIYMDYRY